MWNQLFNSKHSAWLFYLTVAFVIVDICTTLSSKICEFFIEIWTSIFFLKLPGTWFISNFSLHIYCHMSWKLNGQKYTHSKLLPLLLWFSSLVQADTWSEHNDSRIMIRFTLIHSSHPTIFSVMFNCDSERLFGLMNHDGGEHACRDFLFQTWKGDHLQIVLFAPNASGLSRARSSGFFLTLLSGRLDLHLCWGD